MVDVDRRMTGLNPAHIAGLRRLSARAAAAPPPSSTLPVRTGRLSFTSLADKSKQACPTPSSPEPRPSSASLSHPTSKRFSPPVYQSAPASPTGAPAAPLGSISAPP
ncbi:hypothetical protein CsSME_00005677 [Camellia sinensis var. sinensis]